MGSKTPVSILQEMMARLGTPPKYDLILDGSGTHTAVFKFKVYAHNVTAIGSGRSKKEAKHEAASAALEKLALNSIADVQPPGVPPEPPVEVVTPYKDKIQENAVGALQVMCFNYEIPIPEYKLIEEKGAPHEKIFTYVCCVSKQKELGTGRTKKQAKQLAAYNMMNRLKESLGDVLKDVEEEAESLPASNLDTTSAKYLAAVGTPRKKLRLSRSLCTYHSFFIDATDEYLEKGRELAKNIQLPPWTIIDLQSPEDYEPKEPNAEPNADRMEELKQILDAMEIPFKIIQGETLKNGLQIVFIQITYTTDALFYGAGHEFEYAVEQAAISGLRFLKRQLCESVESM